MTRREEIRISLLPMLRHVALQEEPALSTSYQVGVKDARRGSFMRPSASSKPNIGYLMGIIDELELDIDYRKVRNVKTR